MANKKNYHSRKQALSCIPVKSTAITEDETSALPLITYPQPTGPLVNKLMSFLGRDSNNSFLKKIELDEMGAIVWVLIDGQRPVDDIVAAFAKECRLAQNEAEVSVTNFLRELGRRGIIGLREGEQ